ncbi:hypothetical protein [Stutzerimonas zhaodongensis]|uniref:hypothetical protein n=1 Tax=Stutzerimonas zhaodongensis TaxID=1176257 RepID=UPI0011C37D07|nr:hypothetical protein [Stutzerimonas zhaodongensis]MCQ4315694.1 hypothetical protein [Stutzerimonas zhaodongensis]
MTDTCSLFPARANLPAINSARFHGGWPASWLLYGGHSGEISHERAHELALVGHANVAKTSLLRAPARDGWHD